SPRLPTRRMPPFFWASAVRAGPGTSASETSASSTARREGFSDMRHLQIVGEPIYHKDGGRPRPEPPRRRRRGYVRELVTTTGSRHGRPEASVRTTDGTRAGTHSGPRIPGKRRPPT